MPRWELRLGLSGLDCEQRELDREHTDVVREFPDLGAILIYRDPDRNDGEQPLPCCRLADDGVYKFH